MTHTQSANPGQAVGVVVIGRNEGERLARCLQSLVGRAGVVIYVDSGSTDGSPHRASQLGAVVHELDPARPFSAARARNEGFARLLEVSPAVELVQFVDGDCEVDAQWLEAAAAALQASPDLAVVCGRLRERFPQNSIYNRLCDMEWHGQIGDVARCGGIFMVRAAAFADAQGFSADLIAGEEAELCNRLLAAGGRIVRLDRLMAWHDADMRRFGQWWRRSRRTGHAFAEGAVRYGRSPGRPNVREVRRALLWGLGAPFVALMGLVMAPWFPLATIAPVAVALALAALSVRVYRFRRAARRDPPAHAALYAFFCTLGKLPEAQGVLTYWSHRLRGRRTAIIEHKNQPAGQAR